MELIFEHEYRDKNYKEDEVITDIPHVPESLIKCNSIKHHPQSPLNQSSKQGVESSVMNIFPPVNHEGLPPELDRSFPEDDLENNPTSPSPPTPRSVAVNGAATWWNCLRCKMNCIVFRLRNSSFSTRGGLPLCFGSPVATAAAAAMLVALWYLRWQRQRRRMLIRKESRDQLIRVIKEKDEKINTLLRQVAQMNEILLGLYTTKGCPKT